MESKIEKRKKIYEKNFSEIWNTSNHTNVKHNWSAELEGNKQAEKVEEMAKINEFDENLKLYIQHK